jgi:hypothetical protein
VASWTPDSFVAAMSDLVSRYVPDPPIPSVFRWGVEEHLVRLLGNAIRAYGCQRREVVFRYRSAEHFVETFRTFHGPTNQVFVSLDPERQDALEHDLIRLASGWSRPRTESLLIPSSYLEFTAAVA